MQNCKYDSVIVGAGLSGLAAGIRLVQYGKKVLLLEKHHVVGGLNSFYYRFGRRFDVGLHAITNFVKKGISNSPLSKLLRQLRIPYDSLGLCEQKFSKIILNEKSIHFSNDFLFLESEINRLFPQSIDKFRSLVAKIKTFDPFKNTENSDISTRKILTDLLGNQELEDMLLLPILFYGSAMENDVSWNQFVILFKSIFLEGFSRPFEGIRKILNLLVEKFQNLGGEKRLRSEVVAIETSGDTAKGLLLKSGEFIECKNILSSIGLLETAKLYSSSCENTIPKGQLSFCEAIALFPEQPQQLGWNDTITFFNQSDEFSYRKPETEFSTNSGVICIPNNFNYKSPDRQKEGILRVTSLANYDKWKQLPASAYQNIKQFGLEQLLKKAVSILGEGCIKFDQWKSRLLDFDFFSPLTIERFTGHINGAIYGSPKKITDGRTSIKNLYICGTDQGFLGIIGSMLSGISIVNQHLLL